MQRVDDSTVPDPIGRHPANRARPAGMGMNQIELACTQVCGELTQCLDVRPRIDTAPTPHLAQPDHLQSCLFGAIEEGAILGCENGARVPLAIEGEVWDLADQATVQRIGGQTETVCDFTTEGLGDTGVGHGILEFLLLGAYEPYGFKSWSDVAPAN